MAAVLDVGDEVVGGSLGERLEGWGDDEFVLVEGRVGGDTSTDWADRGGVGSRPTISATGSKLGLWRWKLMAQRLS